MKKIFALSAAALILLAGCNTFKGLGQDVGKAGDAISDTAQDTENKM